MVVNLTSGKFKYSNHDTRSPAFLCATWASIDRVHALSRGNGGFYLGITIGYELARLSQRGGKSYEWEIKYSNHDSDGLLSHVPIVYSLVNAS